MVSVKGPGLKIFAVVIALVAVAVGVWITFFQSAGFQTAKATIVSIENDPDYVPDGQTENDNKRIVKVEYEVDGKKYTSNLDSDGPTYQVGNEIEIKYDPKNPGTIHSGGSFGIYFIIAGGVILLVIIVFSIKKRITLNKLYEQRGEITYAPSEQGEQRKLYFLTDLGTPKAGHRIEDKDRRVLYEAKMTKFSMATPYGFDFIDHEKNTTTPHFIGHEQQTEWNMLLIDNHFTFTIDGEDIWKHLKNNGISIESKLAPGKVATVVYTVFRNDEQIAYFETTSQYVHEEDEAEHKVTGQIPTRGFYRIYTSEKNLDLLFTVLLAFARSGAADGGGGTRGALFNTLKNR